MAMVCKYGSKECDGCMRCQQGYESEYNPYEDCEDEEDLF